MRGFAGFTAIDGSIWVSGWTYSCMSDGSGLRVPTLSIPVRMSRTSVGTVFAAGAGWTGASSAAAAMAATNHLRENLLRASVGSPPVPQSKAGDASDASLHPG